MLAVLPPLQIVVKQHGRPTSRWGVDNIVTALEHSDRVREIGLWRVPSSLLEKVLAATKEQFPALTSAVVPDSFMGGSAPSLQSLSESLRSIPVTSPGLEKTAFICYSLRRSIPFQNPHSGYVSPEAMVTVLSTLTRLEERWLGLQSPRSRRYLPSLPPPTRTVLPAPTDLRFKGVSEDLEDLVTRIDAPQLRSLGTTYFYQLLFDIPQLIQIVRRTPKLRRTMKHI
jgi:hypothetical protein